MYKNFVKIFLAAIIFSGAFLAFNSAKAVECCLTVAQEITETHTFGDYETGGPIIPMDDCVLKPVSGTCADIQPSYISGTVGCREQAVGETQLLLKKSGCTVGKMYSLSYQQISCTAFSFCQQKITGSRCTDSTTPQECAVYQAVCFWSTNTGGGECLSRSDVSNCSKLNQADCSQIKGCEWTPKDDPKGACVDPLSARAADTYGYKTDGLLPGCAFSGNCRRISDMLFSVLALMKLIFRYVGALAFIFFIYGGFTMILSFGNSEKFKKGQQVLVAAVIGLVIVFSAYLMVSFLLDAVGISSEFKAIK